MAHQHAEQEAQAIYYDITYSCPYCSFHVDVPVKQFPNETTDQAIQQALDTIINEHAPVCPGVRTRRN